MNNYCTICDEYFTNIDSHIKDKHITRIKKNNISNENMLEDYKTHFDKFNTEDITKALEKKDDEAESPFWTAAKIELNEEDYEKLKEYVNDREKGIYGYSRHNGYRRFSRTS